MTHEEKYTRSKEETIKLKLSVESKIYQEEKNSIINEINTTKEQIHALKNSNITNLIEVQLNRNNLLKVENELTKYSNDEEITQEMQNEINKLNNEKNKLDEWFTNQNNIKNNANTQLLQLLNKQEELSKNIVQIDNIINDFNKKNPTIEETINPNILLDSINNIEATYNTDSFNNEEYQSLKEQFKNDQEIINTMIEIIETNYNISKNNYDEIVEQTNSLKDTLTKLELRNLNKEIKKYELELNIWNKTLEEANKLVLEHNFVDENIVKAEGEIVPETQTYEENQPILSLNDMYNNETPMIVEEPSIPVENINKIPTIEEAIEAQEENIEEPTIEENQNILSLNDMFNNETPTIVEESDIPEKNITKTTTEEEPTIEDNHNLLSLNDMFNNENPTIVEEPTIVDNIEMPEENNVNNETKDDNIKLYIKGDNPREYNLSNEEFNTLLRNTQAIINGDIIVEGEITITINNFNQEDTTEIKNSEEEASNELPEETTQEDNLIDSIIEVSEPNEENSITEDVNKEEVTPETNIEQTVDQPEETTIETEDKSITEDVNIEEVTPEINIEPTGEEQTVDQSEEKNTINNLIIDITNNKDARERIKKASINVSKIDEALNANLIQHEEALNELIDLNNKEQDEINDILNKYPDSKEIIEGIINESIKRDELSKLAIGKINNQEDLEFLKEEDMNNISKLNNEDYYNLIIKLVNKMQYEKSIAKISNLAQEKTEVKAK